MTPTRNPYADLVLFRLAQETFTSPRAMALLNVNERCHRTEPLKLARHLYRKQPGSLWVQLPHMLAKTRLSTGSQKHVLLAVAGMFNYVGHRELGALFKELENSVSTH